MNLSDVLAVMRTQFDKALDRQIPTPLKALEPRDIQAGATECYGVIARLPQGPASGGERLRVNLEAYYAVHYDLLTTTIEPLDEMTRLMWVLQDVQKPYSSLFDDAIDQQVRIGYPDGGQAGACEIFFNPVVRNGGVITLAVNFLIEMYAPHP